MTILQYSVILALYKLIISKIMEVKNTKDLTDAPRVKMLLYGAGGTGKTRFSSTFPKPLYLNIESGMDTFLDMGIDIPYKDIDTYDDVVEVYKFLYKSEDYDSVIFDSVDNLLKSMCDEQKGQRDTMAVHDWGIILAKLDKILRKFRDIDKHVLFIFGEYEEKDGDVLKKRLNVSGKKTPYDVLYYMSIVGYANKQIMDKKEKFFIDFTSDGTTTYAKSRWNRLREVGSMEDPSFDKIYELICKSKKDDSEKVEKTIEKAPGKKVSDKKTSSKKK